MDPAEAAVVAAEGSPVPLAVLTHPGGEVVVNNAHIGIGARAARQASLTGLHVHGGYGFMLEYDIQLYFRRAKAWPLALGDPRRELRRVGAMVLGREVV